MFLDQNEEACEILTDVICSEAHLPESVSLAERRCVLYWKYVKESSIHQTERIFSCFSYRRDSASSVSVLFVKQLFKFNQLIMRFSIKGKQTNRAFKKLMVLFDDKQQHNLHIYMKIGSFQPTYLFVCLFVCLSFGSSLF